MTLIEFILNVGLLSCVSAFILLLASKLGAIEWIAVNGNRLFSELAQCQFCLSWWTNCIVVLVAVLFAQAEPILLLSPFVSTPLTRKMLW